jgi:hypothetical protein
MTLHVVSCADVVPERRERPSRNVDHVRFVGWAYDLSFPRGH